MTDLLQVMEEVNMLKLAGTHPNVVTIQAFFEDNEAYYIVMEMCEGGELYHRLADKVRVLGARGRGGGEGRVVS